MKDHGCMLCNTSSVLATVQQQVNPAACAPAWTVATEHAKVTSGVELALTRDWGFQQQDELMVGST
jgi:hypothetical protein